MSGCFQLANFFSEILFLKILNLAQKNISFNYENLKDNFSFSLDGKFALFAYVQKKKTVF